MGNGGSRTIDNSTYDGNISAAFFGGFFTALVCLFVIANWLNPFSGKSGTSFGSLPIALFGFFPHALLLFGVIADMFAQTQHGVYSIGTLIGAISIVIARLLELGVKNFPLAAVQSTLGKLNVRQVGGNNPPAQSLNIAAVGGPSGSVSSTTQTSGIATDGNVMAGVFETFYGSGHTQFNEPLVVLTTTFMYYILDASRISPVKATSSIVMFAIAAAAYKMVKEVDLIMAIKSAGLGAVVGGGAFGIVEKWYPDYLPSTGFAQSASAKKPSTSTTSTPPTSGVGADGKPCTTCGDK